MSKKLRSGSSLAPSILGSASTMPSFSITDELLAYGVQNPTVLGDASNPQLIDYLDLLPANAQEGSEKEVLPEVVAESQGRPLLYVVNRANLSDDRGHYDVEMRRLRRTLASRGERAYIGILEPGQLSVMPISLDDIPPDAVPYRKGTGEALTFFSRLSLGEFDGKGEPSSPDYVFDEMFERLDHIAKELVDHHQVDKDDVLSLIGRALFFRFLCDRKVVKPQSLRSIAPEADNLRACFRTAASTASTCAWLDRTFNGDFLPLKSNDNPTAFFCHLNKLTDGDVFMHLSAILNDDVRIGIADYQQKFQWAKFDFAHVPVGLLSQVYEKFSWRWSVDAKATSVHYTPRRIADYLVEEAFAGLPNSASARVLDPACGAGIFLVLAFRRLYQAQWKAEGKRPDTAAIRSILEKQITGFEISESALRLSALSLYLTAIELDPEPTPPSKLGFKNLRGRVLYNCRRKDDPKDGPVIGSLGSHVGKEHDGVYDVVLCNPPWTSLKAKRRKATESVDSTSEVPELTALKAEYKALAAEFTRISREVLERRGPMGLAEQYQNPDNVPDLPFVWRSMEWCRSEGRIGMVLPGRLLFKQEELPRRARETLFQSIAVNGILNCSNLTDTHVWPKMSQPFLLLFAQNSVPRPNHRLRWVSPHCDLSLNRKGEVRIDSKSVELVSVQAAVDEPWLWKALAIGTSLDADVVRKTKTAKGRGLKDYWEKDLGLVSSNGYQIKSTQAAQNNAAFLKDFKNIETPGQFRFLVDTSSLKSFPPNLSTMFRPRESAAYRSPLVLVKGFPGLMRNEGWALLSLDDVAFNQSFNGYSGNGNPNGEELVRYLQLFVHSYIWMHRVLMTSPKMGVERRESYKTDLDSCPIIPLEDLNSVQRATIGRLSRRLIALEDPLVEDPNLFNEIDLFFAGLYGLNKHDVEVIRDTLETALPYKEIRERACQYPTHRERERFTERLQSSLAPFLRKIGKEAHVGLWERPDTATSQDPYSVMFFCTQAKLVGFDERTFRDEVLPLASETGASRVILEIDNGLAIALLNQYRYWTPSRARLCAGEILLRHMAVFER